MRLLGLFAALAILSGLTDTAHARPTSQPDALAERDIVAIPRDITDWSALAYATGELTLHSALGANSALKNTGTSTPAAAPVSMTQQVARSSSTLAHDRYSLGNAWSMTLIALALVGYQLRRKHRLLRPQRITF